MALVAALLVGAGLLLTSSTAQASPIIADHYAPAEFGLIPEAVIEQLKTSTRVLYGHTAHGTQILNGMEMIRGADDLYDFNNGPGSLIIEEICGGVGLPGDSTWVQVTRQRLDRPGDAINVVIWSWCWNCSSTGEESVGDYLREMNQLALDYPGVAFIYMTSPLDGTGPGGNVYTRNKQIRDFVTSYDRILFDFADIESFDPDGNYYPDGSDACEWCVEWCASHDCPSCTVCAQSHCYNCYLKGKAFWWLLARIIGWNTPVATEQTSWGAIKAGYR